MYVIYLKLLLNRMGGEVGFTLEELRQARDGRVVMTIPSSKDGDFALKVMEKP